MKSMSLLSIPMQKEGGFRRSVLWLQYHLALSCILLLWPQLGEISWHKTGESLLYWPLRSLLHLLMPCSGNMQQKHFLVATSMLDLHCRTVNGGWCCSSRSLWQHVFQCPNILNRLSWLGMACRLTQQPVWWVAEHPFCLSPKSQTSSHHSFLKLPCPENFLK